MNITRLSFAAAACGLLLSVAPAAFAGGKAYQMTGPIVSLTDTTMVVQKGKTNDNWEFTRTPDTAGATGLKVGDKVTVMYTMTATSVQAKPDKTAKTAAPAAATAPAAAAPAASPAK